MSLPVRPDARLNLWHDQYASRIYEKCTDEIIPAVTTLPRLHHTSSLEFRVLPSNTDFLDLSNMTRRLHITLLNANGEPVRDDYSLSIINFPLMTIWEDIQIYLNQKLVT